MKLRFVLLSLWVGLAVYSIGSFVYGSTGIISMAYLTDQRDRLINNLEELDLIHQSLTYSVDALRYDRDTLEVLARDLGYGRSEEEFIRIPGTNSLFKSRFVVGTVVTPDKSVNPVSESQLRIVAILSSFLTFLFFCLVI